MYLLTCFRIIGDLQDGRIDASALNWPTIFYTDNVYDPEDLLKGLFCSRAAFRVSFCFHFGQLLIAVLNSFICIFLSAQPPQQQILLLGSYQSRRRIAFGASPQSPQKLSLMFMLSYVSLRHKDYQLIPLDRCILL